MIKIKCNDCGNTIDVGEDCFCESCFVDLQEQNEMCMKKIEELENKIYDLENKDTDK